MPLARLIGAVPLQRMLADLSVHTRSTLPIVGVPGVSLRPDGANLREAVSHEMKQSRPCIFCGGAGLTKEHLFPDWLTELFPRAEKDRRTFGTAKNGSDYTLKSENGHSGAKKVREVCKRCNNGWISQIDKRVKPAGIEVIQAKPIILTPENQKTLATWLTKISMVGDNVERERSSVPQEDRDFLREKIEPPPTWQVWISSYSGSEWHHLKIHQLRSPLDLPNRQKTYFMRSVIGMGTMIALVLGHGAEGLTFDIGKLGDQLKRIWPVSDSFAWPTDHDLSDQEVDNLTTIAERIQLVISQYGCV